jgi:hypothetical protein
VFKDAEALEPAEWRMFLRWWFDGRIQDQDGS